MKVLGLGRRLVSTGLLALFSALALSACASSGEEDSAGPPVRQDAGKDAAPDQQSPDGSSAEASSPDASPDAAPDASSQSDGSSEPDAPQKEETSVPEASPDAPPAADAANNPCASDQCYIGGQCVEAGSPDSSDRCSVCLPTVNPTGWSDDPSNTTCRTQPYWTGWTRVLATTPYGHATAISCHNCYVVGANSLQDTLAKVHTAQDKGADLIELDIKDQGGVVYVEHEDSGGTQGARFAQVLADARLRSGTEVLFIETKETAPTEAYIRAVLQQLKDAGYAKPGRPVALRCFDSLVQNLLIARNLLATSDFISMRPYVRLHTLSSQGQGSDIAALQQMILRARSQGLHAVEFEYRTANLFGALVYAKSLSMGTGIYTIPSSMGELYVASLRDETDEITCDYAPDLSKAVVADNTGLVYMNVWNQAAGSSIQWLGSSASETHQAPVNQTGAPSSENLATGEDRFGTSLVFAAAQHQVLSFYDADNAPGEGYLVGALVNFDQMIPADGDTISLVGKADSGGFALELYNPQGGGNTDAVLRFGVYVSGAYRYATYPASSLDGTQSYFIVGAYDGNGAVRLWVNNNDANVTASGSITGGVVVNNSPILLGADPQASADPRFFFSGKVQLVMVQKWHNH